MIKSISSVTLTKSSTKCEGKLKGNIKESKREVPHHLKHGRAKGAAHFLPNGAESSISLRFNIVVNWASTILVSCRI